MPANRRTDIDTGTRSLPGGGYQQLPTSLLRYQDISKISDISVSGETIPDQVKIVRTAHLGVDVKQIVRSIPIIAARHHCNAMLIKADAPGQGNGRPQQWSVHVYIMHLWQLSTAVCCSVLAH